MNTKPTTPPPAPHATPDTRAAKDAPDPIITTDGTRERASQHGTTDGTRQIPDPTGPDGAEPKLPPHVPV